MPRPFKFMTREDIDKLSGETLMNKYKSTRECVRLLLKNGHCEDEEIFKKKEMLEYMKEKLHIQKNKKCMIPICSIVQKAEPKDLETDPCQDNLELPGEQSNEHSENMTNDFVYEQESQIDGMEKSLQELIVETRRDNENLEKEITRVENNSRKEMIELKNEFKKEMMELKNELKKEMMERENELLMNAERLLLEQRKYYEKQKVSKGKHK